MKNNFIDYIRLIKFRYHLSFFLVIAGAFIFSASPSSLPIKDLFIMYFSFNVFLYGGLYTLNDIADIESDRKHPQKKQRSLASKRISLFSAYVFSFFLIMLGLGVGYFYFGMVVLLLYLSFIFINLFYTLIAKKIPYLELIINSATHPLRFVMGGFLVDAKIPSLPIAAIFLLVFGVACLRRILEKNMPGAETRSVLKYYTNKKLLTIEIIILCAVLIISMIDFPRYSVWYGMMITTYVVLVFGFYVSRPIRVFLKWIFLK